MADSIEERVSKIIVEQLEVPVDKVVASASFTEDLKADSLAIVELDFESKKDGPIALDGVRAAMDAGRFVWLDMDVTDAVEAHGILAGVLRGRLVAQRRLDDHFHLIVSGYRHRGESIELERLSVILGERFMLTVHRGPVQFLAAVRRDYHSDFVRFAKSPSFLIYELWDHLIDNYPMRGVCTGGVFTEIAAFTTTRRSISEGRSFSSFLKGSGVTGPS